MGGFEGAAAVSAAVAAIGAEAVVAGGAGAVGSSVATGEAEEAGCVLGGVPHGKV